MDELNQEAPALTLNAARMQPTAPGKAAGLGELKTNARNAETSRPAGMVRPGVTCAMSNHLTHSGTADWRLSAVTLTKGPLIPLLPLGGYS